MTWRCGGSAGTRALGALVVGLALFASACGGSSSSESEAPSVTSPATSSSTADISARVDQIVQTLGSASDAGVALGAAMERGYDNAQILSAVDESQLAHDGVIDGQDPATDRLGLLDLTSLDASGDAAAFEPGAPEVRFVRFQEARDPIPIEQWRQSVDNYDALIGDDGMVYIFRRIFEGDDPRDIILDLILGEDPEDPDDAIDVEQGSANDSAQPTEVATPSAEPLLPEAEGVFARAVFGGAFTESPAAFEAVDILDNSIVLDLQSGVVEIEATYVYRSVARRYVESNVDLLCAFRHDITVESIDAAPLVFGPSDTTVTGNITFEIVKTDGTCPTGTLAEAAETATAELPITIVARGDGVEGAIDLGGQFMNFEATEQNS